VFSYESGQRSWTRQRPRVPRHRPQSHGADPHHCAL